MSNIIHVETNEGSRCRLQGAPTTVLISILQNLESEAIPDEITPLEKGKLNYATGQSYDSPGFNEFFEKHKERMTLSKKY